MTLKIAVIYGSVRSERQGIKFARFISKQLEKRGHTVQLIDPKEYDLPLLDKRYSDYSPGTAPKNIETVSRLLKEAEVFVVVSGEYNHSVPPALKNLLDHYAKEYYHKPAGIATYSAGPFGGVRVGGHLRAILGELGMLTLPTMFSASKVQDSFDDKGVALDEAYNKRIEQFLNELEFLGKALNKARNEGTPY